jgi:hypothetical protein
LVGFSGKENGQLSKGRLENLAEGVQRLSILSRERLSRKYRPSQVRILFVGEAPPASGRFFYQADSGLYRAVRDTFVRAFPDLEDGDFLKSFRNRGCYLVDLCGKPVDHLDPRRRREACANGEAGLSRMIRQLRPGAMVILVRSIVPNVGRAQQNAKWSGPHIELPYPGRWHRHRHEFEKHLVRFLRQLQ